MNGAPLVKKSVLLGGRTVEICVRRGYDGFYEAGISVLNRPWQWRKLQAQRKDAAAKQWPSAVAELLCLSAEEQRVAGHQLLHAARAFKSYANKLTRHGAEAEIKQ